MTWTKLGDEWPDAARDLSDAAYRTHVDALCWSNRRGLDMRVPKRDLRRFAETAAPDDAVDQLVSGGWWDDRGEHWWIGVHFADWQQEAAVVQRTREASALTTRRNRLHKAGDHSLCVPGRCAAVGSDASGDQPRDASQPMSLDRSPGTGRDGSGLGGHGKAVRAVPDPETPPPSAREAAVEAMFVVLQDGLPQPLGRELSRTSRIVDALGRHHDDGWTPDTFAAAVIDKGWAGARTAGAVDRWITQLPPPASYRSTSDRAPQQRPDWCGDCNQTTRAREREDGTPYRCPRCHPLAHQAAS